MQNTFDKAKIYCKDITVLSLLIKLSGWITLFIVDWRVGIALFMILLAQAMQRNLFDGLLNNTIQNILITVGDLVVKSKKREEEKSKKIGNNGSN